MRHRAVDDGDGLLVKSTSVLDRGGEDDDLEEREGLDEVATLGELLLEEEAEIAGCCCCCCAGWDGREWGEWDVVGELTMPWPSVEVASSAILRLMAGGGREDGRCVWRERGGVQNEREGTRGRRGGCESGKRKD